MDNPKEKFFTLTDNLFTFSTHACDCVVDVENIKPGEIKETVKMQSLPDKPLRFAFAPNHGMVRLAITGAINSDRILTDLLAIPNGDKKTLFAFLSEYGFFFPISASDYEPVELEALYGLVNRIKAVVNLMSSIGEAKKDYRKILGLTLYLQLSHPIEFIISCFGNQPFKTCEHALYAELENLLTIRESLDPNMVYNDNEFYTIPDTIYPPAYELDLNDFNNILGGFNGAPLGTERSRMFKGIARLYGNATELPSELRRAIDFYFHYQHSIAVIKKYNADGSIEYFDTEKNVKSRYASNFNDSMKQALIDIAKVVIRDEIGYNLGGMRPQYDISTMSPAWEIQDFLTGIYVSIFFMRPGLELYRKCANPSCDRSFLVDTTSRKRKYCSSSCRNATSQRAHRFRKQAGLKS